jgi:hypothetical protein
MHALLTAGRAANGINPACAAIADSLRAVNSSLRPADYAQHRGSGRVWGNKHETDTPWPWFGANRNKEIIRWDAIPSRLAGAQSCCALQQVSRCPRRGKQPSSRPGALFVAAAACSPRRRRARGSLHSRRRRCRRLRRLSQRLLRVPRLRPLPSAAQSSAQSRWGRCPCTHDQTLLFQALDSSIRTGQECRRPFWLRGVGTGSVKWAALVHLQRPPFPACGSDHPGPSILAFSGVFLGWHPATLQPCSDTWTASGPFSLPSSGALERGRPPPDQQAFRGCQSAEFSANKSPCFPCHSARSSAMPISQRPSLSAQRPYKAIRVLAGGLRPQLEIACRKYGPSCVFATFHEALHRRGAA